MVSPVLVGAITSALGGIGLVVFVGGAVLLARFRGSGIPGVTAASKVSRSDAVAVGGDQLLALIVLPLAAAVLLVAANYPWVRARHDHRWLARSISLGVGAAVAKERALASQVAGRPASARGAYDPMPESCTFHHAENALHRLGALLSRVRPP